MKHCKFFWPQFCRLWLALLHFRHMDHIMNSSNLQDLRLQVESPPDPEMSLRQHFIALTDARLARPILLSSTIRGENKGLRVAVTISTETKITSASQVSAAISEQYLAFDLHY